MFWIIGKFHYFCIVKFSELNYNMNGKIIYNKDDDYNIIDDMFKNKDVNGKCFNTKSYDLHNNVKINLDAFPLIIEAGVPGQKVLYYIISHLKFNTNVITINRKEALIFLGSKDPALITEGLKRLIKLGIIVPIDENSKNNYYIPLNNIVRGNVNTMLTKLKEEQEEERIKKEEKSVKSYTEIVNKHKLKLKLKHESKNNK